MIMLPSSKFGGTCPPQGIFALQKSLRVGCDGGRGPHRRGGSPRAKKFPEEICFALDRVLQICRTPRLQSAQKYVARPIRNMLVPGSPGCQRGRCPSVSEGVQRKPFQGFPLGNFFLTADAVLLCAAKKNGVGTTRLEGFCQFISGACATDGSQKSLLPSA